MDLTYLLGYVHGYLSELQCRAIQEQCSELSDDSCVLDLYAGEGRSTILMALTLEEAGRKQAVVISVDTHITNPVSDTPYEEGTFARFYANLRRFKVMHRVVPIVAAPFILPYFLNRRSANLVHIQVPLLAGPYEESLIQQLEVARHTIRKGGLILCSNTNAATQPLFRQILDRSMSDMRLRHQTEDFRVYLSES